MSCLELETFIENSSWKQSDGKLFRQYRFPSYRAAADFVQILADMAEEQNHHPELLLEWKKISVWLFTHDEKAIGQRDIKYAQLADQHFSEFSL